VATLGCKLNQYDSEEILAQFRNAGYEVTESVSRADICVVNTCAVTATAERKARSMLRSMRRSNPGARLLAVGCMSERTPETLTAIPGVDVVLGNREKLHILDFLPREHFDAPAVHVGETAETHDVTGEAIVSGLLGRTRSFLKVQDGCSQKCTYCIIPRLRGAGRSLDIRSAVERAQHLVEQGFIEIVLTGVALGTYGFDRGERDGLANLLEALEKVDGLERIRLGSVEPWAISDRMLRLVAGSERICPHLHIPLQSCEDTVLHRMNRRYTTTDICHLFDFAFSLRDDWGFGTDIIVGFPGETEEQYCATQNFLEDSPVAYVHIFPYSSRPGTPATRLPGHWSQSVKNERVARLKKTDRELRARFRRNNLGRTHHVLFEHRFVDGYLAGHAPNYLDVYAAADATVAGRVCNVKITELHPDGVVGEFTD
jgi:threonylcarbamoyladenosine tRNA methylthiotransferase MtaB